MQHNPTPDPHYMADSWRAWRAVQDRLAAGGPDITAEDRTYLPSPAEVQDRLRQMRWMINAGYNPREICTVMEYSMPPIELVYQWHTNHGHSYTRAKIRQWRVPTDYDKEHPDDRTEEYRRREPTYLRGTESGSRQGPG